jgi:single-strand DNA-binding protein
MPNRNMHEIMGHLGKDPERSITPTGRTVCRLSIATLNNYFDARTQEWVEKTPDWHNVIIWDDLAEKVAQEFSKGDAIMVRGKSRTREYQGKDGQTRRITEVTASEIYKPVYVPKKGKQSRASDDEDIAFEDDFQEDVEIPF